MRGNRSAVRRSQAPTGRAALPVWRPPGSPLSARDPWLDARVLTGVDEPVATASHRLPSNGTVLSAVDDTHGV